MTKHLRKASIEAESAGLTEVADTAPPAASTDTAGAAAVAEAERPALPYDACAQLRLRCSAVATGLLTSRFCLARLN